MKLPIGEHVKISDPLCKLTEFSHVAENTNETKNFAFLTVLNDSLIWLFFQWCDKSDPPQHTESHRGVNAQAGAFVLLPRRH